MCTPDRSYTTPSQLSLASAPAGLHQVIEPTHWYRIYGYTPAEVEQQTAHCAPASGGDAGFAGETDYRLNWYYNYADNGSGACTLSNLKVGLHVQVALPLWQASSHDATGLASAWQRFISGLNTHEQGHVSLDQHYAATLLQDLQALPPSNCATIEQTVNATANRDVAALNSANDAYDARTNHGASQGAIMP